MQSLHTNFNLLTLKHVPSRNYEPMTIMRWSKPTNSLETMTRLHVYKWLRSILFVDNGMERLNLATELFNKKYYECQNERSWWSNLIHYRHLGGPPCKTNPEAWLVINLTFLLKQFVFYWVFPSFWHSQ